MLSVVSVLLLSVSCVIRAGGNLARPLPRLSQIDHETASETRPDPAVRIGENDRSRARGLMGDIERIVVDASPMNLAGEGVRLMPAVELKPRRARRVGVL